MTRAFDTDVDDAADDDADVNEYSSSARSERKNVSSPRSGPDVIDDAFGGS